MDESYSKDGVDWDVRINRWTTRGRIAVRCDQPDYDSNYEAAELTVSDARDLAAALLEAAQIVEDRQAGP